MALDLQEGEKIVNIIRRHWLAFAGTIGLVAFMLIIFLVGAILTTFYLGGDPDGSVLISKNMVKGMAIILANMFSLSVIGYFYIAWLDYYLDIFVITNERIIRLEQIVLFGRRVSETSFQHIQDVSAQVKGFWNTMFGVGTVFVETAGERENFSFICIKNPSELASKIMEIQRDLWDQEGEKDDLMRSHKASRIDDDNKVFTEKKETAGKPIEQPVEQPRAEAPTVRIQEPIKQKPVKVVVQSEIQSNSFYKDGRVIIEEGVIWQADQEVDGDILGTLNEMER